MAKSKFKEHWKEKASADKNYMVAIRYAGQTIRTSVKARSMSEAEDYVFGNIEVRAQLDT